MDLKQLRYFVAIVEYGSLTKAAKHLRLAQPALSLQLANLEAECRGTLLVRTPKGVALTEVGRILYRHARIMLRQMEQAKEEMQNGAEVISGIAAVGLPAAVAVPLAAPLVRAIRERFPGIRLQLFESPSGYLSELLANNRLDLAILYREVETRGLSVRPILTERFYLVGSPGAGTLSPDTGACDVSALRDIALVLPSQAHDLRHTVDKAFAKVGLEPNVVAEIESSRTMLAVARDGMACTILPLSALPMPWERPEEYETRQIVAPEIRRTISLCRIEGTPHSAAAIAVEKVILSLIPQLVEEERWPGVTLLDTSAAGPRRNRAPPRP